MMTTHQDEGLILRLHSLGEDSLILVVSTPKFGLISVVAQGAKKEKSRFRGKIDLFYEVELSWREGRTLSAESRLHSLVELQVKRVREGLRADYGRLALAAYFTKLYEKSMEKEVPEESLHALLGRALGYLETNAASLKALLHFEKELVRLHGYGNPAQSPAQCLTQQLGSLPRQRASFLRFLGEESPE